MDCRECGKPATAIAFTKGNPEDVPLCKKCANSPKYKSWMGQTLNTADSPTGRFMRAHLKGVS
jgi:hypothetical protein